MLIRYFVIRCKRKNVTNDSDVINIVRRIPYFVFHDKLIFGSRVRPALLMDLRKEMFIYTIDKATLN